jgi:hypothetical protein
VQVATVARLAASGADVLVVVADRDRRRRMLRGPLSPQRFGGGTVTLAEYGELEGITGFAEAVALDPPADADATLALENLAARCRVHLVWGAAEIEFAREVAELRAPLRPALVAVWKAHRTGSVPNLPPETVAACLAVLAELGLDPAAAPGAKVDLERSPTYREALERFAVVERHLGAHAVG